MTDKKLIDDFRKYLNTFESDPELHFDEDYFKDRERVLADDKTWADRYVLIELNPDDEGGPSTLFVHYNTINEPEVEFACWTFDTSTMVWIKDGKEVKYG